MTDLLEKVTALLEYLNQTLANPSLETVEPLPSSCYALHNIAIDDTAAAQLLAYLAM